jgi:hypothetical protein
MRRWSPPPADHRQDHLDELGQGPLQGVGEPIAGGQGAGADPDQDHRGASPHSASARPARVSGSRWCDQVAGPGGARPDPPDQDLPGLGPGDGVDQHHQRRLGDVDGQLGGELVAGQDSGAGQAGVGGQPAGGVPADPVVTAQRVAVADDQDAGPVTG